MSVFGQIAAAAIASRYRRRHGQQGRQVWRDANRYAVDQQMRPYNLKEPYYDRLYSGAEGALNDALATGAYTGPTYATLDPMQREAIAGLGGFGRTAMGYGTGFMNAGSGFADNAAALYDRAGGRTLDDAVAYATSSPQARSLIDAAMLNDRRRLEEQQLPGIRNAASATNNTRSSKAAIAEEFANRAYDDRRANVATGVYSNLANQYLRSNQNDFNNLMRANAGLRDVFGTGSTLASTGANALSTAGGMLQTDSQGQLDADREAFQRQRDFRMNQFGQMNSLLGGLPTVGQVQPNTANPYTAALSGAMMGAGFGGNMYDYFNRNRQQTPAAPTMGYGSAFGTNTPYIPQGL